MKFRLAFSLLIVCTLLIAASVLAAPSAPEILWRVIGGGGGRLVNGSLVVEGTLGQPVAGVVSQPPLELCSGYWCSETDYRVYLPLTLR